MATVWIPMALRGHTGGRAEIDARGETVLALLQDAASQYAGLRWQLFDDRGQLRRFVNVFLNSEDIRLQDGLETAAGEGDVVEILPAMAGG